MKRLALLSLVGIALAACSSKPTQAPAPAHGPFPSTISEALNSHFRTAGNEKRDQYRHPAETLEFFGLKPDMTVVEISPGAGWYAEILAPYLSTQGKYIAAAVPVSVYAGGQKFLDWTKSHPELESKITVVDFAPPKMVSIGEDNSADMVLTFRNVHNWTSSGGEKEAFKAFFKVLKPGGVLGVVEHRAGKNQKQDKKYKSGYVPEKEVIRMAEKAGFKLVAKSEINANPKDTKNYPKGVWTLPPSYAEGDKNRERYAEIGESDRMTLKFMKP
ncbi:methyltransferase [Bdellovibrio bacteriovorus]|uniref:Methyltransferase n=1 Tax=Bdellovibrio bacteriovorus TaxID=959 RepID=A0A150WPL7_BDEBC|nr:class I SAM-dependent methyltransferase [Bdellovibrio bacteriovorus]KYG66306.1 methyltransferase [Bdellovibrio bacteriovorus]